MPARGRLAPRARATTILLGLIGLSAVLASGNVELNRVKLSKCFPNTNDVHRTAGAAAEATAGDGNSDAAALVTESFAENEQEQEAEQEQDADEGGRRRVSVPQPFMLPELVLQWDSWPTSQIVTAAAAIVLQEKMGFNIKLESGRSSQQVYEALATGDLHMAFEVWPGIVMCGHEGGFVFVRVDSDL